MSALGDVLLDHGRVTTAAFAEGARPRTEVLWLNPQVDDRLNGQLRLRLDGAAA